MRLSAKDVIAYWHTSLADATLPTLDPEQGVHIALADLSEGTLPADVIAKLVEAEDEETAQPEKSWDVVVIPFLAQKIRRGRLGNAKFVCPLLIPAQVDDKGILSPTPETGSPWIPRVWLEPVAVGEVVLGSVEALEAFLTTNLLSLGTENAWDALLVYAQKMLESVSAGEWRTALADAGYQLLEDALLVQTDGIDSFSGNITAVYDQLLDLDEFPKLIRTYAQVASHEPTLPLPPEAWDVPAQKHLGSFGNKTALSPSQREALYHALLMTEGEVLAVSGPPGTGKTTLLQSVVASEWVRAALARRDAPIIVATSTNNQAVTNVLDSFAKARQVKRWLPEPVQGFGLYLVNAGERQKSALKRGIPVVDKRDKGFPQDLETAPFIHRATADFLRECSNFLGAKVHAVDQATNRLHEKLSRSAALLSEGLSCAHDLFGLKARIAAYGNLDERLADLSEDAAQTEVVLKKLEAVKTNWLKHLDEEAWLLHLFKKRRQRKRQLFWRTHLQEISDDEDPGASLERELTQAKVEAEKVRQRLDEAVGLQNTLQQAQQRWTAWCNAAQTDLDAEQLHALETPSGKTNEACLHAWLDTHLRFDLFVLATHYFEGRWLQAVKETGLLEPDYKPSQAQAAQLGKWRRYAMLTPCFVTTMHSGPAFFDYWTGESRALFDFIDLLIVDEAGQVAPQVSAGMVALAKKALVVGDSKQLEPVWGVEEKVDRANLKRHLTADRYDAESFEQVQQAGITASSGSVMQIAKALSKYQKRDALGLAYERGMFLAEHYRCDPKIIAYCNELAYRGRLKPKRGVTKHPWPRLGYVHVKGDSLKIGGSRQNEREAETLVAWIVSNRDALLAEYKGKANSLNEIIGIVTPFKPQERAIKRALSREGIALEKVGTVHTLQGAERPFILFSSVYTSRDQGSYFFDLGVNMLNVAVSRAQDSFLVFGDMDIFDPVAPSPSGLLARHLFADQKHELTDVVVPKRPSPASVSAVNTLEMHRRILKRAFEKTEDKLFISSPFLSGKAVRDDEVCSLVRTAKRRGAEVIIYVDDSFTQNLQEASAKQAALALLESGAQIKVCHNIHSKIVCVDKAVFIEGSFNWLSASRDSRYARYEHSLVYQGKQVAQFIEKTLRDLEHRVIEVRGN